MKARMNCLRRLKERDDAREGTQVENLRRSRLRIRATLRRQWLSGIALVCAMAASAWGQSQEPISVSEPFIWERGPHHRTWMKTVTVAGADGRPVSETRPAYIELGTGMHYRDPNKPDDPKAWLESSEEFELFEGGAVARKGPHQVIVSPRITDAPAVDMQTPDGKRLQCRLFGVVYRDTVTGNNVLIAEPNPESIATVVPPNRIVWENALLDFSADLQVTYTRAGIEAELIFRERPDSPDAWNLNAGDTRIQVWTEWFDPPEPRKEVEVVREETDPNLRRLMAEPQVVDCPNRRLMSPA